MACTCQNAPVNHSSFLDGHQSKIGNFISLRVLHLVCFFLFFFDASSPYLCFPRSLSPSSGDRGFSRLLGTPSHFVALLLGRLLHTPPQQYEQSLSVGWLRAALQYSVSSPRRQTRRAYPCCLHSMHGYEQGKSEQQALAPWPRPSQPPATTHGREILVVDGIYIS